MNLINLFLIEKCNVDWRKYRTFIGVMVELLKSNPHAGKGDAMIMEMFNASIQDRYVTHMFNILVR